MLGRACSDIHWPAEAGQLIFDKRGNNGLNLAVLHLSAHMMAEEEMYGQLGYGDKDTFVRLLSLLPGPSAGNDWILSRYTRQTG